MPFANTDLSHRLAAGASSKPRDGRRSRGAPPVSGHAASHRSRPIPFLTFVPATIRQGPITNMQDVLTPMPMTTPHQPTLPKRHQAFYLCVGSTLQQLEAQEICLKSSCPILKGRHACRVSAHQRLLLSATCEPETTPCYEPYPDYATTWGSVTPCS